MLLTIIFLHECCRDQASDLVVSPDSTTLGVFRREIEELLGTCFLTWEDLLCSQKDLDFHPGFTIDQLYYPRH